MMKYISIVGLMTLLASFHVHAESDQAAAHDPAPAGDPYQLVSDLVPMPEFLPGMGRLYVDPETLPAGPFLAYDRNDKLVSTVYMIPLEAMNNKQRFAELAVADSPVQSVDITYNPGHPGVAEPHYHITLYHTDPKTAALE